MSLLAMLLLIIILGVVYYFATRIIDLIPMDGWLKSVAHLVLLLFVVLVVLQKILFPLLGITLNLGGL